MLAFQTFFLYKCCDQTTKIKHFDAAFYSLIKFPL